MRSTKHPLSSKINLGCELGAWAQPPWSVNLVVNVRLPYVSPNRLASNKVAQCRERQGGIDGAIHAKVCMIRFIAPSRRFALSDEASVPVGGVCLCSATAWRIVFLRQLASDKSSCR